MVILKIIFFYIILKLCMRFAWHTDFGIGFFLMTFYAPIIVASGPIKKYIESFKKREDFLFYNLFILFYHIIFSLCFAILHEVFFKQFIQTLD